jgi:hypothetical protein
VGPPDDGLATGKEHPMWLLKTTLLFAAMLPAGDDRTRPALIADTDRDIDAFYDRYREAQTDRQRANAILDLCQIHNQIWSDPRYASIEKLRGMRNRVVFQLKTAQKALRKSGATEESNGDDGAESQRNGLTNDDPQLASIYKDNLLLGWQYAPGPGQAIVHAGSFAGDDNAPQLIALIESTIHPEHWSTNGGPGNIHYYRPVMALIIRAGSAQHDDVARLLQGVRDNGR